MTDQMNLLGRQGSYQEELALLEKVKQAEVSLGASKEEVDAQYQIAVQSIQDAMKRASARPGMAGARVETQGPASLPMKTETTTKPAVTVLQPAYPNPFNPTTTIHYQLAKPAR